MNCPTVLGASNIGQFVFILIAFVFFKAFQIFSSSLIEL